MTKWVRKQNDLFVTKDMNEEKYTITKKNVTGFTVVKYRNRVLQRKLLLVVPLNVSKNLKL